MIKNLRQIVQKNNVFVCRLFSVKAQPTGFDGQSTALHRAVARENQVMVEFLLAAGGRSDDNRSVIRCYSTRLGRAFEAAIDD